MLRQVSLIIANAASPVMPNPSLLEELAQLNHLISRDTRLSELARSPSTAMLNEVTTGPALRLNRLDEASIGNTQSYDEFMRSLSTRGSS